VNEWLTLQPDLQYIVNPGLEPALRDAMVLGLRFELAGSWPMARR
jgi:porin